ncbi:coat protein [Potexvirus ecsallii]|uniref:Coat protein n=1 Tax=Potexvirus ecsallii TaxID=317027 RepID=C0L9E5_9VIRU|nr:coat protein [Allium virus X]ACN58198.1 coat protein [Allium virus X]
MTDKTAATNVLSKAVNSNAIPFTTPKPEELSAMTFTLNNRSLPTPGELIAIAEQWKTLGVPGEAVTTHALQLTMFCYHSGSSPNTEITGDSATPKVTLAQLAGVVMQHTTLRKFCRFFAPLVWNWALDHKIPPASWQANNFPPDEKYAAFDFFDGVTNGGSMLPADGLRRQPTPKELIAHATAQSTNIFTASQNQLQTASTHLLHTKGRFSTEPTKQYYLPGPEA